MWLSLNTIRRDTAKFQFRSAEFNEERVQWLVANWDDNQVDPLDVWRTEEGDFLLSGHHRFEAATRLGKKSLFCRIHEFTIEEAQTFALKSNANRLQYTDYEYSRCVTFLKNRGATFSEAANELTLSVGMAKKYYSLRFLIGTDWESQATTFDLTSRAFEVGKFCESEGGLSHTELQSLFKITVDNDLTATQLRQLLRDIKRQREQQSQSEDASALFDLNQFSNKAVRVVKERHFLDQCAAQAWWLYELLQKQDKHEFPAEMKESFERELKRFHAYCIGSEDSDSVPTRASTKGRKLRVNLEEKAS